MASSLQSLFPEVGRILGMTPAALYAHQRKFTMAGLLPLVAGRGPRSGVPGNAKSLATFLICLMTNANLAENVLRARELLKAQLSPGEVCALTGQTTFHEALVAILSNPEKAKKIHEIVVSSNIHATIEGIEEGMTRFDVLLWDPDVPQRLSGGLEWRAVLIGSAVIELAMVMAKLVTL
jgi:hypothetical protein